MKSVNWQLMVAVGLILLAVVLAGLIGWKYRGNFKNISLSNNQMVRSDKELTSETSPPQTSPSFLTPAEISALNTPTASTSAEERKKHFDVAIRLARKIDKLIIKECFSIPTVIEVKNNQVLKIENSDNHKHVLSFDKDRRYEIDANSSKEVTINLPKDGLYGYACDGYTKATGLMLINSK